MGRIRKSKRKTPLPVLEAYENLLRKKRLKVSQTSFNRYLDLLLRGNPRRVPKPVE